MSNLLMPITDWVVNPSNGLIESIVADGKIFPVISSGCEIGNWLGFYSQHKQGGINCILEYKDVNISNSNIVSRFKIRLPKASFSLFLEDKLERGVWRRRYTATALNKSWLGDFVIRLGISADYWKYAGSGKRRSNFIGWNTYRQYSVDNVVLQSSKIQLKTEIINVNGVGRMARMSYWRDEPVASWMIHHRLIVTEKDFDHVIARFRNTTKDSIRSPWVRAQFIRRPLWALSEKWLSRLPLRMPTIQMQGVIEIPEGDKVVIESEIRLFSLDI